MLINMSMTQHAIPYEIWMNTAEKHRQTAREWTVPCRTRKGAHQKHPVFDFLFTYYPFSLGRLEQWHPGPNVALEVGKVIPLPLKGKHYFNDGETISLAPETLSDKEKFRLSHIVHLLKKTRDNPPNFSCFGMHEWAMVYGGGNDRHREDAPLRLSQEEVDHLVESRPLCCSHFDAVRFIPPTAQKLNKLHPTLEQREHFEQPGCLHANMDLYKWASKAMPWLGSPLLWDCFQLALEARELDMRASVYDLSQYGYSIIPMETAAGREEYESHQRALTQKSIPLRQSIIDHLDSLLLLTLKK